MNLLAHIENNNLEHYLETHSDEIRNMPVTSEDVLILKTQEVTHRVAKAVFNSAKKKLKEELKLHLHLTSQ